MEWAVILAGGAGTRFWPLSSPSRPKQLLPLVDGRSTAVETLERLRGLIPPARTLLVTGAALAPRLAEQLRLPAENILIEPRAASTGPALVWATWEARRRDPDAAVLSLHADWTVKDAAAFTRVAAAALASAARHDALVTVGIVPSRPETAYGYIEPGAALDSLTRRVERFTEKPDAGRALDLMAGGALWNSGLFAWTAERLLAEVRSHTPEIARALGSLEAGDVPGFFAAVEAITIDVGLLERSDAVAVVAGDFDWDDVGTWEALARIHPRDGRGNVCIGMVAAHESSDCIVWSERVPIVLAGVRDLVVVEANGRILVLDRGRAADLKKTLDALPASVRELPD